MSAGSTCSSVAVNHAFRTNKKALARARGFLFVATTDACWPSGLAPEARPRTGELSTCRPCRRRDHRLGLPAWAPGISETMASVVSMRPQSRLH